MEGFGVLINKQGHWISSYQLIFVAITTLESKPTTTPKMDYKILIKVRLGRI